MDTPAVSACLQNARALNLAQTGARALREPTETIWAGALILYMYYMHIRMRLYCECKRWVCSRWHVFVGLSAMQYDLHPPNRLVWVAPVVAALRRPRVLVQTVMQALLWCLLCLGETLVYKQKENRTNGLLNWWLLCIRVGGVHPKYYSEGAPTLIAAVYNSRVPILAASEPTTITTAADEETATAILTVNVLTTVRIAVAVSSSAAVPVPLKAAFDPTAGGAAIKGTLTVLAEDAIVKLVIVRRPTLLGLDPKEQVKRIVEYLKDNDYSTEEIVKMISETI
eukprot:1194510-Prorocentrum_minimum.AAC.5